MTDITRENIILKGIAATVLTICTVVVAIKITADLANIPDVTGKDYERQNAS